jgi:serine/threonine-protein kinase
MPRRLVVLSGPDQGRSFPLPEDDALLLGRSRATGTRLADPHVSRVHCEVTVEGGRAAVHDFDSVGGTFVNGRRVTREELRPGDVLRVGETELRLEDDAPAPSDPGPAFKTESGVLPPGLRQLEELAGQSLDRYELLSVLGAGQVGLVFEARDRTDGGRLALKVLKPEFARDEKAMQRFVRGMKASEALDHPHLVTVYAAGRTGPYWWVAMEYVEGQSLAQQLRQRGEAGRLDWAQALRVAVHVGRALAFAHGQGLVHRNVIPPNILLRRSDSLVKLSDLLLAKALEGALGQEVTRPGELVGNVYYMSPERTQAGAAVDGRADVWGLGVTVYQALAGRLPFTGATFVEVVNKIRRAEPERPAKYQAGLPPFFEQVVLRMLAKRPEQRYTTAGEMVTELEQLAGLEGVRV